MKKRKTIALVAHDNCKQELLDWVGMNWRKLIEFKLVCTGTTGRLTDEKLKECIKPTGIEFHPNLTLLKSGPLGGDQQLGAMICNGGVDILIFFWDAMEPQPHDVDIKALLRIATLYNIVYGCTRSSADFIITSSLLNENYTTGKPEQIDFYQNRELSHI